MLLFIALANSHYFLAAPPCSAATRATARRSTRRSRGLISTFVDGRAFPLFGLLFGYGVAQIVRRHASAGKRRPALLWRRAARWS